MAASKSSKASAKPKAKAAGAPQAVPAPEAAGKAGDAAGVAPVRKKDFLERVAAASGAKKGEVRLIGEAVLAELGAALARGEELALPPFGKLRVTKHKDGPGGAVLTLKLRRPASGDGGTPAESDDGPLADDAE